MFAQVSVVVFERIKPYMIARLNGDEARARREKIRRIGRGSAIDDYIFEWAAKPLQISPSPPNKNHNFDTIVSSYGSCFLS